LFFSFDTVISDQNDQDVQQMSQIAKAALSVEKDQFPHLLIPVHVVPLNCKLCNDVVSHVRKKRKLLLPNYLLYYK
jgi:hypothetical protein